MAKNTKEKIECMQVKYVKITDNEFFTPQRLSKWRVFVAKCCKEVCENIVGRVDPVCNVTYFLSTTLVKETVADAVIGMSKIIDGTPHPVKRPNAFKIAAYLSYWFLRHKPISVLYPENVDLDKIQVSSEYKTDAKNLSWQLKHINEVVAVNMATAFIFNFEKEICGKWQCSRIKRKNTSADGNATFGFDDFNQQRKIMLQKLTYYFAYRALAPKVIEHMLEGYAFHPAWGLTGAHWNTAITENVYEV